MTLTLNGVPEQLPAVAVTLYIAVTGLLELLISVPLISLCPDADVPPV